MANSIKIIYLTAIVPTALWSAGRRQMLANLMKQNNLLIEGFKPGASRCLLLKKIIWAAIRCFPPLIFCHVNNTVG